MANKITIVREEIEEYSEKIRLNNGDLIIIESCPILMVTSFNYDLNEYEMENSKCNKKQTVSNSNYSKYCSLINLKTGGKAFAEPCSRNTIRCRVANHIVNMYGTPEYTNTPLEVRTSRALKFEQIKADHYSININILKKGDE